MPNGLKMTTVVGIYSHARSNNLTQKYQ